MVRIRENQLKFYVENIASSIISKSLYQLPHGKLSNLRILLPKRRKLNVGSLLSLCFLNNITNIQQFKTMSKL